MSKKSSLKFIKPAIIVVAILSVAGISFQKISNFANENAILKEVIKRLEADSRLAEVLVTGVNYEEKTNKSFTTIKLLEYDVSGEPLEPKYFTFSGNIIQFQSLVIRFNDIDIRQKSKLKDKSVYLFWKVFLLDGENTQEYELTKINEIPQGYKVPEEVDPYEKELWQNFWTSALDPKRAQESGIKNAQIEAPGTMFVPGHLYTINIEHDGGLRIDSSIISPILRGEKILDDL